MTLRLRGAHVTLRPFRAGEFDVLWAEETADRGAYQSPVPDDQAFRERLRRRVDASGSWTRTELLLAIEAEGALAGDLQARRDDDAMPPGLFEVGIGVFRGCRGRGVGTEALSLLTEHLFLEEFAHRVQLSTDVDNVAMRRSAEKAGFTFEGVLRGYWPVPDGPARDFAMYARTRPDHERSDRWTRAS
ncbi:MAG TPA: GNAT family protein [Actinomycetota bacterium]|nr:GNAT family protein [Actinomycetota bacterium]